MLLGTDVYDVCVLQKPNIQLRRILNFHEISRGICDEAMREARHKVLFSNLFCVQPIDLLYSTPLTSCYYKRSVGVYRSWN